MNKNKLNIAFIIILSSILLASCWTNIDTINSGSGNANTTTGATASAKQIMKSIAYQTPEWTENIKFNIWLNNDDTIANVSANVNSKERETIKAMQWFNANINKKVVWKKLSELQLDTVGWASLTTAAFNKAIAN